MNQLRRFLVLLLVSFCFGGFLFYAGIVVPAGARVVGSTMQGFITRQVTSALNIATIFCILGLLWDICAERHKRSRGATRLFVMMAGLIALCCLSLLVLHRRMDALLIPDEFSVRDSDRFYLLHRIYLWISTIQWLCSLVVLWILAYGGRAVPIPDRPSPS